MDTKILATVGPSSLKREVITEMEEYNVSALRINLSHTPEGSIKDKIEEIQSRPPGKCDRERGRNGPSLL